MLASLTKEQGARVVQSVWGGIKRQTGEALNQTVQSTSKAARTVVDVASPQNRLT